ncbi:MAG: hypothetical protein WDN69_22460 [Aliidongia sp.]
MISLLQGVDRDPSLSWSLAAVLHELQTEVRLQGAVVELFSYGLVALLAWSCCGAPQPVAAMPTITVHHFRARPHDDHHHAGHNHAAAFRPSRRLGFSRS